MGVVVGKWVRVCGGGCRYEEVGVCVRRVWMWGGGSGDVDVGVGRWVWTWRGGVVKWVG